MTWDLSCPDWEQRIREGRSLVPDLPLITSEAELGQSIFDEIRLPDVPGKPRLGEAAGPWFRDIVRASFGSWEPAKRVRFIRDIFAMAPKGSSKTSYSAGLMLAVMCMNQRPRAEALFVGPTQAVSDRAYEQAVGMIEDHPDLKKRFRPRDHIKTIEDLTNYSEMKVKTFDLNILTGAILIFALLDELHLLGRNAHTGKVLRQIRGGLDKTAEGQLLITTTQSDDVPAGAFKDELQLARQIRDGKLRGANVRPMLPVLYEYPDEIAKDPERWQDPVYWPMVMPNLGRSVHLSTLIPDWNSERTKGEHAIRIWASQHLNLEIGMAMRSDRWAGADFWEAATADEVDSLQYIIEHCDVAVAGIDGGGLDDLLGLGVVGREKTTRRWLSWCHGWAHRVVFERRKDIAAVLHDFEEQGDLTIVDEPGQDIEQVCDFIELLFESGLLPSENGIGVDPVGVGQIVDELVARNMPEKCIVGISQGWKLSGAIKTAERGLNDKSFVHASQPIVTWCVSNAKVEPRGNALTITKQAAGSMKIDLLMALFNAVALMSKNPLGGQSVYEERGLIIV